MSSCYFHTKPQHKVLWRHPWSKHWQQLDLIIVRHTFLNLVLLICLYHSANCDTDHLLVCCRFGMQPRKLHHTIQEGKLCLNTIKMKDPESIVQFVRSLGDALNTAQQHDCVTKKWDHLWENIYYIALLPLEERLPKPATGSMPNPMTWYLWLKQNMPLWQSTSTNWMRSFYILWEWWGVQFGRQPDAAPRNTGKSSEKTSR